MRGTGGARRYERARRFFHIYVLIYFLIAPIVSVGLRLALMLALCCVACMVWALCAVRIERALIRRCAEREAESELL